MTGPARGPAAPRVRGERPSLDRRLVVWWPDWPVLAAGAPPGEPMAVVRANRVLAASRAARADGVRPGQRRRDAQARCPSLRLEPHDPDRDARRFESVLHALGEITPFLEVTRPGTCSFATRGPSRYHGGDEALARLTAGVVARAVGIDATEPPRVAIADGRFAATVSAHLGGMVVPPGATAAFLAPLPIATLRLAEVDIDLAPLVDLLQRLGLRTLGDLAALPAADVVARFGPPGRAAHRLAEGGDGRVAEVRRPPPDLAVQLELDPPAPQVSPVVFAARRLAEQLHERLATDGLTCTHLVVSAETEDGERHERGWRHPLGLTTAAMVERVRWQLDGWAQGPAPPTSGLTLLRLTPHEVVADVGRQLGFWGGTTGADERAARTVARLSALLGPDNVRVPEWRGGRDPGAAVVAVPALGTELGERAQRVVPPAGAGPWPGRVPVPSPATVLTDPQPAEVVDADGRPVAVGGRGEVSGVPARLRWAGCDHEVVAWAGPWPLEEHWWDPAARRRRARFQLLTALGTAVLASVEGGRWWVEATYD